MSSILAGSSAWWATRNTSPRPLPAVDAFPRLHVLLTEDYKMDPALCERLAGIGRGAVFRVAHHAELPAKMLDIANRVLR